MQKKNELEYRCNHYNTLERQLKHLEEDYAHLKAKAGKINRVIEELKHLKGKYTHLKDNYAQIREENALLKKENTSTKKTISALAAKGINAKTNTTDNPWEKTIGLNTKGVADPVQNRLMRRRLLIRQIVTYAVMNSQSQLIRTI